MTTVLSNTTGHDPHASNRLLHTRHTKTELQKCSTAPSCHASEKKCTRRRFHSLFIWPTSCRIRSLKQTPLSIESYETLLAKSGTIFAHNIHHSPQDHLSFTNSECAGNNATYPSWRTSRRNKHQRNIGALPQRTRWKTLPCHRPNQRSTGRRKGNWFPALQSKLRSPAILLPRHTPPETHYPRINAHHAKQSQANYNGLTDKAEPTAQRKGFYITPPSNLRRKERLQGSDLCHIAYENEVRIHIHFGTFRHIHRSELLRNAKGYKPFVIPTHKCDAQSEVSVHKACINYPGHLLWLSENFDPAELAVNTADRDGIFLLKSISKLQRRNINKYTSRIHFTMKSTRATLFYLDTLAPFDCPKENTDTFAKVVKNISRTLKETKIF